VNSRSSKMLLNNSADILRFASGVGGFGRVTGRQVVLAVTAADHSGDMLGFASAVAGFGRVTGRQVVLT